MNPPVIFYARNLEHLDNTATVSGPADAVAAV